MFKLKKVMGGISLEKVYEGTRGISYRLGVLRNRISQTVLSGLQSLSKEGEDWYPGKQKEIEKARRLRDEYRKETGVYLRP
jgi:hypothetical protein